MAETELERAEKRYAQAKARLLAGRDAGAAAMLDRLVRNLPREQDRRAFVGWKPGDALPENRAQDGAGAGADLGLAAASAQLGQGA